MIGNASRSGAELREDRLADAEVQPRTSGLEAEPPPQAPCLAAAPHTTPHKGKFSGATIQQVLSA